MQAVILAAGKGTRMGELTASTPKPLLEIGGKTLLEYKFEMLPESIDEIIVIVGYLGGEIHDRFGGIWRDKRILYVEQENIDGTAGALYRATSILHDRFLVLMGDDLYSKEDAQRCLDTKDWSLLVQETDHMQQGGMIVADQEGGILDIVEGDHKGVPGLIGTNMFALDVRLFDYPLVPKSPGSEEYGLPQTVLAASRASGVAFQAVKSTFWFQITDQTDLQKAEEMLRNTEVTPR